MKRIDVRVGDVDGIAEELFQTGIDEARRGGPRGDRADEDALTDGREEGGGYPFFLGGGFGVGVFVRYFGVHFFSIEARIATGSAPERYISIASRATSMHTAQP
jgi:hypothetical protein